MPYRAGKAPGGRLVLQTSVPPCPQGLQFSGHLPTSLTQQGRRAESPGLVTRTQVFFPWPYQGFTRPASTAVKWGHSYHLCPPSQVPQEAGVKLGRAWWPLPKAASRPCPPGSPETPPDPCKKRGLAEL